MGAKKKLNSANVVGALMVSALIGMLFGSWAIFAITSGVLVASGLYNGDIRR